MKLGHVTLLAIVSAIVIGFILPADVAWLDKVIWFGGDLIGQYLAYLGGPLLFFSMIISVVYLKRRHILWRVLFKSLFWGVLFSISLASLAVFLVQVVPFPRLIILFEYMKPTESFLVSELLLRMFPTNMMAIFTDYWFLPLFVLALVIGLNMNFDMESIEPAFNLFDSLSRIFFQIIYKASYVLFVPIFFLTVRLVRDIRFNEAIIYYKSLFIAVLLVITGLVILLSLMYYLIAGKRNPFGWLYGVGTTVTFAFLGGHQQSNYSLYSIQSHKNQNVKRDLAGLNVPFFMLFIRSGTAFLVAMSMMLIIKSYSMLNLDFGNMVSVVIGATISSIFLPLNASFTPLQQALEFAATFYPSDVQNGLHAIEIIIAYLSPLASVIDMLILAFLLRIFAYQHDFLRNRSYI